MMRHFLTGCLLAASTSALAAPPSLETQTRDLEVARTEYVLKSPSFSDENRRRAVALIDAIEARHAVLTPTQFLVTLHQIAALANNAHDGVHEHQAAWQPSGRLPFRLFFLSDGAIVSRASPAYHDLLGARIDTIEGLTPARLQEKLRTVGGGTDAANAADKVHLLESAGVLHAMGLAAAADALTIAFVLPDGRHSTRRIAYVPREEVPDGMLSTRLWSSAPFATERAKGWKAAAPDQEPLYLQDADTQFRSVPLAELDALYVQLRGNFDYQGQRVTPFAEQVIGKLRQAPPRHLILDLRLDPGGDCSLTRELMRTIAATVPGKIYLLVGRRTFSAGIVNAAALKHDGGARVTIVGEPVGDRLQFWSEGYDVMLPVSRYGFRVNDGYWDLAKGCAGTPRCYGDQYDAATPSLAPDLPAPITTADWLAGRDPGLAAIRRELQRPLPK